MTQDAVLGIDQEHLEDCEACGFYSQGEKITVQWLCTDVCFVVLPFVTEWKMHLGD